MIKHARRALAALAVALAIVCAMPSGAFAYTQERNIVSSGHGSLSPSYLVVHETANPGVDAWNHVLYWSRNSTTVSMTHFVMSLDGHTVYQTQETDRLAWHIGGGNRYAYGIELCHATDAATFASQWEEATQWCADQLTARGWGIDRLLCHNDARLKWGGTTHTDPLSYFATYGKSWDDFKADVAAKMGVSAGSTSGDSSVAGDVADLAAAVMRGEYGNGDARRAALGDRYAEVQAYVNTHYFGISSGSTSSSTTATVDIASLAAAVMRGEYGNGAARRSALGSNYDAVQAYVNAHYFGIGSASTSSSSIASLAAAVMRGEYGNGAARRYALGSNYAAVQAYVNSHYFGIG